MTATEVSSLIVATATLLTAIGGLVVAIRTGAKVAATHELVNGQSHALNELTGKAAFAEGKLAGAVLPTEQLVEHGRDTEAH